MDTARSIPPVTLNPPLTAELRGSVTQLWRDVSLNGGAVGFTPGSAPEVIEQFAACELEAVSSGRQHLIVSRQDDSVVAMSILKPNDLEIMSHWMELKRFMVHPTFQGTGLGRAFAEAVAHIALETFGLEQLQLTARSGQGTESFWEKCGYSNVATLPERVKLGPNDYRDVYCFVRELRPLPE